VPRPPQPSLIRPPLKRPPGELVTALGTLSPTALAAVLGLHAVMHHTIRPLWPGVPRIAGPAFTVRTAKHDSLMLHAAIYRADAGDVLVVEAGDHEMAVADGSLCAVAQRRGIAGFVIHGLVRDVAELRQRSAPVFARGVSPILAGEDGPGDINAPVTCGGVRVNPGDVVVADEEGIVVVPRDRAREVLRQAQARSAAAARTLDEWERKHRARIEGALRARGYLS
jgi:regulator of RNase E activity RraA